MIIVDVNILIYAVDTASPHHSQIVDWWNGAMNDDEPVGLCWLVLNGFLRLTTRSGILNRPLSVAAALQVVETWLAVDHVVQPKEATDHWAILKRLLAASGTGGNLVTDAHLAALAIGNGATLVSCDRDFARFPGLSWTSPLSA